MIEWLLYGTSAHNGLLVPTLGLSRTEGNGRTNWLKEAEVGWQNAQCAHRSWAAAQNDTTVLNKLVAQHLAFRGDATNLAYTHKRR